MVNHQVTQEKVSDIEEKGKKGDENQVYNGPVFGQQGYFEFSQLELEFIKY